MRYLLVKGEKRPNFSPMLVTTHYFNVRTSSWTSNFTLTFSEIYALTGDAQIIIMSLKTLILSSDFILLNCRPVCCKNLWGSLSLTVKEATFNDPNSEEVIDQPTLSRASLCCVKEWLLSVRFNAVLRLLNPLIRSQRITVQIKATEHFSLWDILFFQYLGKIPSNVIGPFFSVLKSGTLLHLWNSKNCMRLFNYQDFFLNQTNKFVNRHFTFSENNGHQKQ